MYSEKTAALGSTEAREGHLLPLGHPGFPCHPYKRLAIFRLEDVHGFIAMLARIGDVAQNLSPV